MKGATERVVFKAFVIVAPLMFACSDQLTVPPQGKDAGVTVHGPGFRFYGADAPQQAAIDALLYTYPFTERDRIERGGMICRDPQGAAFATEPVMGEYIKVNPAKSPCPKGSRVHGDYHTHAAGPLKNLYAPFSTKDTTDCTGYEACWVAQKLATGERPQIWVWLPGLNGQFHVYP